LHGDFTSAWARKRESFIRKDREFFPHRPMILASLPFLSKIHLSQKGIIFAVLSGAFASDIGYSVWYFVLKFHTATRAAILQLSVPALAGLGGVIFLFEIVSLRLLLATVLILGGISLAIVGKGKKN